MTHEKLGVSLRREWHEICLVWNVVTKTTSGKENPDAPLQDLGHEP